MEQTKSTHEIYMVHLKQAISSPELLQIFTIGRKITTSVYKYSLLTNPKNNNSLTLKDNLTFL